MTQPPLEDRRQQILAAALEVFAEKGFRGATNRDIARAAGIAPGLIYWYFKSKEDLFGAVLDEYAPFGKVAVPFAALAAMPPEQVIPLVVQGFSAVIAIPTTFLVLRLLISETVHNPAAGQRFNALFRQILDPLSDYLRGQIARGRLRDEDPLLMAQGLISNVGLFYIRRLIGQDPDLLSYATEEFAGFVVGAFMRAFGT